MESGDITLEKLSGKNLGIYVRLNRNFQSAFFSKKNTGLTIVGLARKLNIDAEQIYQWKNKNIAFPLSVGYEVACKHGTALKWEKFCSNVKELKSGERSTPLEITESTFPMKKRPPYWSVLFALFCDGSSDTWSSQKNSIIETPRYTSYDKEVLNNFIDLVRNQFGNWKHNPYKGTVSIPLLLAKIFKSEHKINSFNTRSSRIQAFKIHRDFREEIKNLDGIEKASILARFLVDEGDKSEKSINPRYPNLTVTTTSRALLKVLETVLTELEIKYHVIRRRRHANCKQAFIVQIVRGKKRENYRKLKKHLDSLATEHPLCKLTSLQTRCLESVMNYSYKKPGYELTHTKAAEYAIVDILKSEKRVHMRDLLASLDQRGFDLSPTSVSFLLRRMPARKEGKFWLRTARLNEYLPYTQNQIQAADDYSVALKLYGAGMRIASISKRLDRPWATIRDWVYGRAKPSLLLGPWANTYAERDSTRSRIAPG